MTEKLINLPLDQARAEKWRRGQERYGPVFAGDPLDPPQGKGDSC